MTTKSLKSVWLKTYKLVINSLYELSINKLRVYKIREVALDWIVGRDGYFMRAGSAAWCLQKEIEGNCFWVFPIVGGYQIQVVAVSRGCGCVRVGRGASGGVSRETDL